MKLFIGLPKPEKVPSMLERMKRFTATPRLTCVVHKWYFWDDSKAQPVSRSEQHPPLEIREGQPCTLYARENVHSVVAIVAVRGEGMMHPLNFEEEKPVAPAESG